MTSAISPPRRLLADCSPRIQRTASTTLLLPDPFGPTMAVMPGREVEPGLVGERLEPDEFQALEHGMPRDRVARDAGTDVAQNDSRSLGPRGFRGSRVYCVRRPVTRRRVDGRRRRGRLGPKMRPGSRFSGGRGGGGVYWAAGSGSRRRQVEAIARPVPAAPRRPRDLHVRPWPGSGHRERTAPVAGCSIRRDRVDDDRGRDSTWARSARGSIPPPRRTRRRAGQWATSTAARSGGHVSFFSSWSPLHPDDAGDGRLAATARHANRELGTDRQRERAAELDVVAEQHDLAAAVAGQVDHARAARGDPVQPERIVDQGAADGRRCSRRPAAGR